MTLDILARENMRDRAESKFLVTLPYGPWESRGWASNPGAREHVRHWATPELIDVFGETVACSFMGAPCEDGLVIGHTVAVASGECIGYVNMHAKYERYRIQAATEEGGWLHGS